MMEWEDKNDVNKTWGACKMFFKNYYELKKRYSNARPDRIGFESAENVADKNRNGERRAQKLPPQNQQRHKGRQRANETDGLNQRGNGVIPIRGSALQILSLL